MRARAINFMAINKNNQVIYRQFRGEVVSASGNKTVHVLVKTKVIHPKYRKQYLVSNKYPVHDSKSEAKVGDLVTFQECRPLSKTKKWRLVKISSGFDDSAVAGLRRKKIIDKKI